MVSEDEKEKDVKVSKDTETNEKNLTSAESKDSKESKEEDLSASNNVDSKKEEASPDSDDDSLFGADDDDDSVAPKTSSKQLDKDDKDLFDSDSSDEEEENKTRTQEKQPSYTEEVATDDQDYTYGNEENKNYYDEDEQKEEKQELNVMDEVLNNIKRSKVRRGARMTEDEKEEIVHDILMKMDAAYNQDVTLRRRGEIALNKIKLLPEVLEIMNKNDFHIVLLERNLLQVVGQWLRPIKNHQDEVELPNLGLRTKIYKVVNKLPIDVEHLSRAKFGKVISYLRDSERETKENRVFLRKLVQKWSRGIFGRSDDFKMLEKLQGLSHDRSHTVGLGKKRKIGKSSGLLKDITDKDGEQIKPRYRAQIPQQQEFTFTRNVQSGGMGMSTQVKSGAKSSKKERMEKKLNLNKRRKV
eukprot:augustus_masked-scaffold_7-processed-gene-14.54-mRNA-1 protein AED:1.00 eAED:1.00 QI:0/-1/0/0/-1/1/1/0/412